jgi:hypothetical protein
LLQTQEVRKQDVLKYEESINYEDGENPLPKGELLYLELSKAGKI